MKPVRMCIVCRERRGKSEFIRIVKNKSGGITIADNTHHDGRGAYICENPQCIDAVIKRRGLNRAFKGEVSQEIYKQLASLIK